MNVFRFEFLKYRRALIGWCIGLCVFICIYLPFMPAFMNEAETVRSFFEGMGQTVLSAMGINLDAFFSPLGFFSYVFMFISLIGCMQAIHLGLSVVSRETRLKTADFLLTKTKTRARILIEKLLASVVCLLITQFVFFMVCTFGLLAMTKVEIDMLPFLLIILTFTFLQLLFLAMGFVIATLVTKIKSVLTVSMGLCMGFFMLGMVSNITSSDFLRALTPMRYFDYTKIIIQRTYEPAYLLLCFGLTVLFSVAAYVRYTKKDIHAV